LVKLKNIELRNLISGESLKMSDEFSVIGMNVPHRSEYTDTMGFIIQGKYKKALFIPDIDSWDQMKENIEELLDSVDFAFLDGTFYNHKEIPHRNIKEIPHPFIEDSIHRLKNYKEKSKIFFIHLNHTNPCLNVESEERKLVKELGFNFAEEFQEFEL
jgi:pyrroloquinoline quinone biosynthesis protein B